MFRRSENGGSETKLSTNTAGEKKVVWIRHNAAGQEIARVGARATSGRRRVVRAYRASPGRRRSRPRRGVARQRPPRDLLDYHSLARSLALAARAAELTDDTPSAAELYFRAGRTAAAQNDTDSANRWLGQAIALSRDPSLTRDARSTLTTVGGSSR
jgi:hypothetical protein